ncbi:MAG: hypothetical protein R3A48_22465 [Polyangiales bacterium]
MRAWAAVAVASGLVGASSTVAAQTGAPPPNALVVNGVFEAFLERAKVGVEYQIHPFQREYGGHGFAFGLEWRHFTSELGGAWNGGFASLRYSYDAVLGGVIVVSPYASVDVGFVEDSCSRDLRAPNGCYGALALVSGGVDLGGIVARRWLLALRVGLGSIPIYDTNRTYSTRLFEVGVSAGVLF